MYEASFDDSFKLNLSQKFTGSAVIYKHIRFNAFKLAYLFLCSYSVSASPKPERRRRGTIMIIVITECR